MKKRRSMVYVQPGKDVTVYVPADTPPEVIEYLNQLKAEGTFSQGVVEIITQYVQRQQYAGEPVHNLWEQPSPFFRDSSQDAPQMPPPPSVTAHASGSSATPSEPLNPLAAPPSAGTMTSSSQESSESDVPTLDSPLADHPAESAEPSTLRKLNLAQIFQQAKRNSGKLME